MTQTNESAILAQKQRSPERSRRLRALVIFSTLPLLGMAVAFGLAPATDPRPVETHTVIESIGLPEPTSLRAGEEVYWSETRIQRGDTIASVLERLDVKDEAAFAFVRSTKEARTLYRLVPGRPVRAKTDAEGRLLALRYLATDQTLLEIDREGELFRVREGAAAVTVRIDLKSGVIENSLFGATDAAGIPDAVAVQMAEIFSSDIDFHLDLRKGDRFSVVYETIYSEGEPLRTGRVLAAEFVNAGKTYHAVFFRDREGREGYYTPDGKSLRKAFLRSPLPFSRVTSGFTSARFHPVLKTWRAHKGVDYAAPTGTPVRAVADGIVDFAGRQGGYGNLVVLKHRGTISTAYGHLSGFAKGIKRGRRVKQGEVIGYVGATGLATGPHLHYEFRVAGVQRNPLTVPMPRSYPIATQYRQEFLAQARDLMGKLALARGLNLARID